MGTSRHHRNRARAPLALIVGQLVAAALLPTASAVATATFIVNSYEDAVDAAPGNGACATSGAVCTLRAAVMEANALAGADVITLGAGPHTLSLTGADEEAAATGDLDITGDVTINGVGSRSTVVIGSGDRVFNVRTGGSLDLSGVQVAGGSASRGAGIYVESGSLDATDVGFVDNSSGGGALYLSPATTSTLTRSLFWRNSSTGVAGGILNHQATLTIDASEFVDNAAAEAGGGLSNLGGATTITNSTFRGNRAAYGGAIQNGFAATDHGAPTLTLTNVTISENGAGNEGGGLRHARGTATLTNVTIARNWANVGAGLNWGFEQTGLTVKNSIIADNWSGFPPVVDDCLTDGDQVTSLGHNITTEAACPFTGTGDLTSTDPQLLPLADHGGATYTMGLPPGSPALGGGDCSTVTDAVVPAVDQRGSARVDACDVGAFERQNFEPVLVWDLANDFETAEDPAIQPDDDQYGNPGVWSYRQSTGTAHDVTTYQPLSTYFTNIDGVAEFEGWATSGGSNVLKNASAQSVGVTSRSFLPGRVSMHPAQDGRMAVAAWTAPFAMIVTISGHAFDRDWGCGSGFGWAVETSTEGTATATLASGSEANSGSVAFHHPELRDVRVAKGQTIYLVISPDGGWDCDTTEVDLTITGPAVTSSHVPGAWSRDATIDITLIGATVENGVAGYSYVWSSSAGTEPDEVADASANGTFAMPVDGRHWFHIRMVDAEGVWGDPLHVGPFKIDTAAPGPPRGTGTPPKGGWTSKGTLRMSPLQPSADLSGVTHFIGEWTSRREHHERIPALGSGQAQLVPLGVAPRPLTDVSDGEHYYFHARAVDAAGNRGPTLHYGPIKVDRTAPTKPELDLMTTNEYPRLVDKFYAGYWWGKGRLPIVAFGWRATDAGSGIDHYVMEWTERPVDGVFSAWESVKKTTRSDEFKADHGTTYCFRVRAVDAADPANISPVSATECAVTPLHPEDLNLEFPVWRTLKESGYFYNQYHTTTVDRAEFTTINVGAGRVHVMYATCPTCGSFKVLVNGDRIATIDTHSARVKKGQQVVSTRSYLTDIQITIEAVLDKDEELRIEAVGASRTPGSWAFG